MLVAAILLHATISARNRRTLVAVGSVRHGVQSSQGSLHRNGYRRPARGRKRITFPPPVGDRQDAPESTLQKVRGQGNQGVRGSLEMHRTVLDSTDRQAEFHFLPAIGLRRWSEGDDIIALVRVWVWLPLRLDLRPSATQRLEVHLVAAHEVRV